MFRATKAKLTHEGDEGAKFLTIQPDEKSLLTPMRLVKRYEFSHKNAYMSVISRDTSNGKMHVFIKGSFDKLKDILLPESIPDNADMILKGHAANGYYVLALAYSQLPHGTSTELALRKSRDDLERNAIFAGFILFRNEVKADTPAALTEIRKAGCRSIMVTGDNVNTAIYIAWMSGMIYKDWQNLDPMIITGTLSPENEVVWKSIEDDQEMTTVMIETLIQRSRRGFRPVEIAIDGKVFRKLAKDGWLHKYLLDIRIFAGMKPDDKIECVRYHMKKGVTAMCGDGGNDAGALKAAHAGIALTDSNNSVVGHFSCTEKTIQSVVLLLREARCSLDLSMASYKFLLMYGEILAFTGIMQFAFKVTVSQAMQIMIDASTVPLSWAISLASPARKLIESRPTARPLGKN